MQLFPARQAMSTRRGRGGVRLRGTKVDGVGVSSIGCPHRKLEPTDVILLFLMQRSWRFISYRRHVDIHKGGRERCLKISISLAIHSRNFYVNRYWPFPLEIAFRLQLVLLSYPPIFLRPYLFLKRVSFLGANRNKSASAGSCLLRGAI